MRIVKARIHNFRGVLDQEVMFESYSLLVGPNNSGKSSIIDALRAFYEKDGFRFKKETDLPFLGASDSESWIDLEFSLTDEEHDSLADDYKGSSKLLRVRKYFHTAAKTHDNKPAVGAIFGYKSDGALSTEPFYGAKNVQSGKFGDLVYIPAISKVDEHAKLSGPSALRDLLSSIMSDVVESGAAYSDLAGSVQKFSAAIRDEKTADDRSLRGFEEELNTLLKPWESEFRLTFPPPSAAEIIKSMLAWDLVDGAHGKPLGIDSYGSGFQRHFIYSLIQVGSRYIAKKPGKKAKDFVPDLTLVLFEEPEAFLHPPQQEALARELAAIARSGAWQVVCATHSAHFVSRNSADIPAIVRLRRRAGLVEKYQIDAAAWDKIVDANQAINAIAAKYPKLAKTLTAADFKPEMEALKYFLWMNADRSSMFFANHVLLVEGPTEVGLINRLVGDGRIGSAASGLYVLDCIGKHNIHRFMNLLSHLGIQHSVLHDDDHGNAEHAEINQLIQDSRHASLTSAVRVIAGDLEAALGIPKAAAPRKKPQHVLYLYETGAIELGKLDALCAEVSSCLPTNGGGEAATEEPAGVL